MRLFVPKSCGDEPCDCEPSFASDFAPATVPEVVEWLREQGAGEEVTFFAPHIFPARDNPEYDLEMPAGRYYVVALTPTGETR